ncbi:MAG: hypothetical protein WCT45_01590 [Candidatus Paceibacterota bacterium]|jgi:hypothetical protein
MNTNNSGVTTSNEDFDIANEPVGTLLWLAFLAALITAATGYYGFVLNPFEHDVESGFWLMIDRLFCCVALYMTVMFTGMAIHKACSTRSSS